jgi:hypothetical protein
MRPEAQPANANNSPIVTMRRMIANPLNFAWARLYQNRRDSH